MKLVVLGSGTCLNPPPGTPARMPPLFALDVSDEPSTPQWILFDCSEGARWRLPAHGIDPRDIRHIALSHPHPDHAALPQFIQSRTCEAIFRADAAGDLSLSIYAAPKVVGTMRSLWLWHQPEDLGAPPSRFALRYVAAPDGFATELFAGVWLRAFSVFHGGGRSPAVAFRVETPRAVFAYSGDTGLCDGVVRAARDATLFVCEASARVGEDMSSSYGHLNPRQAGAVAREANAARVVLTHYTGFDSDDAMLAECRAGGFTGALSIAHDGAEHTL